MGSLNDMPNQIETLNGSILHSSKLETKLVVAGYEPDPHSLAVVPPISVSSTFAFDGLDIREHMYSRLSNPTRIRFEKAIATCEGAKHAMAFSSGMAASVALLDMIPRGAHIVRIDDMYGGTVDYINRMQDKLGYTVSAFSTIEELEDGIKPDATNLIWIESVTNPTLKMMDIRACCHIAKSYGSQNLVVVDNTFLSPYGMSGLSLGCDIVLQSVTKYINGHSDVVMGVLAFNDDSLFDQLSFIQRTGGAVPSPFDCFLAHRGLRTLALRMRQHEANALQLAHFLEAHPMVTRTLYIGLSSHPNHDVARKQVRCFGGMITFYISGGLSAASAFLGALRLITVAVSLGGVESLIEHPALMTHKMLSRNEREELGISDGLLRMSVGIEDAEDLQADLAQALDVAGASRTRILPGNQKRPEEAIHSTDEEYTD